MNIKSFSLFGKELFRLERDIEGNFNYSLLDDSFDVSEKWLEISLSNPIIQTIIALRSKIISQMEITHLNKDGIPVKNSEVLKILKSPNYFQTQQDFLYQLVWFMSATGTNYCYQKKNAINNETIALFNLIPSEIDLNNSHKLNTFIATENDLKEFKSRKIKYKLDNIVYEFELNDIIPFYDLANGLTTNSFMKSQSRLNSLKYVIDNIEKNLKSKNTALKFSQKYLATNQGVTNGIVPQLTEGDRKSIEGVLHNKSLQITNVPIKVQQLVSDFKKMFLDEMFSNDALTCLLAFEMNRDVLNYFSNSASTHENQTQGFINWLQNSVQTDCDSILDSFSQTFGLFEKQEKLVASFDHLPVMAKVMNEKIATLKSFQETMKLSIENGMDLAVAKKMIQKMIEKLKL